LGNTNFKIKAKNAVLRYVHPIKICQYINVLK